MHLFTEIFPLDQPPTLTAYLLRLYDLPPDFPTVDLNRLGRTLVARLRKRLPGGWLWQDSRMLTDTDALIFDILGIVESLKAADPDYIGMIETLDADFGWMPDPAHIADFVIRTRLNTLDETLNEALGKFNRDVGKHIRIEREYKAAAWNAGGMPAVSLTVAARLLHEFDGQAFIDDRHDPEALIDLRVSDRTSSFTGEAVKIIGTVGERREKLLQDADKDALRRLIKSAIDTDSVVRVKSGEKRQDLPARALEILVRPSDFARFGVDERAVTPVLRPDPPTRSQMIKALSDILKDAGMLGKAFNAREHPALFSLPDFQPFLRFAKNRSRPFALPKLPTDFVQCGAYHLRSAFETEPIRVGVVNALTIKIEDFVEALQRQLKRNIGEDFKIEVIRERKVRVVSLENVESAVRTVEKDQPDLILAFLPDPTPSQTPSELDDLPAFVKSLTMGRAIPGHVIFQTLLDDPDAMPGIILAILAKTGNTPFALADPLDFADFVVGLDLVEQEDAKPPALTAIARVYRANGEFVRYAVRSAELVTGQPPFVLMRDLFPQRDYAGKRVVLHYEGKLPDEVRQALNVWGQAIKTAFAPVEIIRRGAPRLYAFAENRIQAPAWGSTFRLNDHEGFVVLNLEDEEGGASRQAAAPPKDNTKGARRPTVLPPQPHIPTPQPLHIIASGITLDQAVRSLQLWTLLYYGATDTSRLPVTVFGAGELAYWVRKGGTMSSPEGEVPFWL